MDRSTARSWLSGEAYRRWEIQDPGIIVEGMPWCWEVPSIVKARPVDDADSVGEMKRLLVTMRGPCKDEISELSMLLPGALLGKRCTRQCAGNCGSGGTW